PVGCSSPATQRSVVVLPQPDGPSSTTISPAGTVKLTPSTAGLPAMNAFTRSRTSSVAATLFPLAPRHRLLLRVIARLDRAIQRLAPTAGSPAFAGDDVGVRGVALHYCR